MGLGREMGLESEMVGEGDRHGGIWFWGEKWVWEWRWA